MLNAERLRELLHYDPETGVFTWLVKPNRRIRVGSQAGSPNKGYLSISVDGKRFAASRLAWLYVLGKWPEHGVDHWDGVPANNRFGNLRDIPQKRNLQNRTANRLSKSGVKGVSPTDRGRWLAQICVNGKQHRLLETPSKQEAEAWYKAFADLAYGAHALHNRPSSL